MTKKEIIRVVQSSVFPLDAFAALHSFTSSAGKKAKSKDKIIENITSGSTTESCKTPDD